MNILNKIFGRSPDETFRALRRCPIQQAQRMVWIGMQMNLTDKEIDSTLRLHDWTLKEYDKLQNNKGAQID